MFCLWVRLVVADCAVLRFFMARVCMTLAVFSFMACGELSTCMMLLISSFVSLTSRVFPLPLSCMFGIGFPLPLFLGLGLLVCCLSLFVRMGLRPRQFLCALHSLWLLGCSPLQLISLLVGALLCHGFWIHIVGILVVCSWQCSVRTFHICCIGILGVCPHMGL